MPLVAPCVFREPVKTYYLDPGELSLQAGHRVVGETLRGVEMGTVKFAPREMEEQRVGTHLRRIIRIARQQDLLREEENRVFEEEALLTIRQRVAHHSLAMKPIKVEVLHDRSKLFYYYESEDRVDFRELLKDLTSRLEMRIHFQQVGSREAARAIGGCGLCGQPLCCSAFLTSLPPVTLKMAKEQHLSLTPTKISGACGRLMCCLRYEVEFYRDQNQKLPRTGDPVDTPEGPGNAIEINALSERIVVRLEDGRHTVITGEQLRVVREQRGPVRECGGRHDERKHSEPDMSSRSRHEPRDGGEEANDPEGNSSERKIDLVKGDSEPAEPGLETRRLRSRGKILSAGNRRFRNRQTHNPADETPATEQGDNDSHPKQSN